MENAYERRDAVLRDAEAFVKHVAFRAPVADAEAIRLLTRIRAALADQEGGTGGMTAWEYENK